MTAHPLIAKLREERRARELSQTACAEAACMSRAAFAKHDLSGRWGAVEQFARWAEFLGYRLALLPRDDDWLARYPS